MSGKTRTIPFPPIPPALTVRAQPLTVPPQNMNKILMRPLSKFFVAASVLLVLLIPRANASYYHANVKEGSEFLMFDVRFPGFMPSGTYFSFWNGGVPGWRGILWRHLRSRPGQGRRPGEPEAWHPLDLLGR